MPTLITPHELAAALHAPKPPRILDVRWRLDVPDGRPAFREAHIPSAVYVDLDNELAEKGAATEGRHPLPPVAKLQQSARRWGLNDGDRVVVYDDIANMSSARAWWLLRHAGLDVQILDGALAAWRAAGLPLESGGVTPPVGDVTLSWGHLDVVSPDEVAVLPGHGLLLDARAPERYRGDTEPVDPQAGHIPGARNTPTGENVGSDGRFLSPEELRARFAAVGAVDDATIATYCGSGVTAAHNIVALNLAGFEAALYPGSWSQWSNLEGRPVETGDAPERQ